jgi:hypothetical protein
VNAAPLDRPTRVVTFATCLLLLVVFPLVVAWGEDEALALWIGFAVGAGVTVVAFGFAPAGYEVEGACLLVRRQLFGSRAFTVTGKVVRPSWRLGFGGLRMFGSSGLFGWYGRFWKPGVGRYLAYVTDRSRLVACDTDAGLVMVSPSDPDELMALLRGRERP